MAYNMSFKKGKYPGEPGYAEWTGFEKEMKIPGTLSEKYKPIEPNTFLKKLISNKTLSIKPGQCFSDYSIRNQIEMENIFNLKSGVQINCYTIIICSITQSIISWKSKIA